LVDTVTTAANDTAGASVDEVRTERKQRLAGAFRLFAKFGFEEGLAGHITARDPERLDCFWVNPIGMPFAHITVSDLLLLDSDGAILSGSGEVNLAAFMIHSAIHEVRPDVISAAHSHSVYGRAWSTLGRMIDPLTQDACAFYGRHSVYHEYNGVVLSAEEGKRVASALGPTNVALILQNHGLLTVGTTVDEAAWNYICLERNCQVQLLAEAAGTPILIDAEVAAEVARTNGPSAWWNFQPLWKKIVREQPDFLH
jgi:ribulose-5-phosphate 4-epimerase/fuculose-1-phosphate aldolase